MFAHCKDPVWRVDDFTTCFQRDFLQILFPLIACGASFLQISFQISRRSAKIKRGSGYKSIPNGNNSLGIPGHHSGAEDDDPMIEEESEDEEVNHQERRLSLQRMLSKTDESVVEVDRPRGEVAVVVMEELALLAEVAINLAALLTHAWGPNGTAAAVAGLVTWSYIFILATLRLFFSSSSHFSFPKLWYHTAFLYGFQWLFTVLLFRSAIIHPRSRGAQISMISNFVLATILALIALLSRKGNKAVKLEYEDDLEPSKEPLASVFSLATFSWVDQIVWKGYKKTYELPDVWNLIPKDKAASVLADYRQAKKTSKLAWHLLKYFHHLLWIQAAWAAFSGFFTFAPTLLMKVILEYVEKPEDTPKNAAWFYIILLFASGCVRALADGQALWVGRKMCIRLRAIVIGEIYAKALRRKAAAGTDTILGVKDEKEAKPGLLKRIKTVLGQKEGEAKPDQKPVAVKDSTDAQVNTGTIINLMAVDSFKVGEVVAYLHFLWASVPVQLIVAIVLLYRMLGYSSIAGLVMMVLLLPLNIFIAQQFSKTQKKIMAATDGRIHTINEVLQNIRIIKFFAWEDRFGHIVDEKRQIELRALRNRYILWAFASTIWNGAPIIITFMSFFVYTVIEKKELIPSVAFTALSLFSILRIPLDQFADMLAHVQESKVSVDRVEEFLGEEETEKYMQLLVQDENDDGEVVVGFDNATFTWTGGDAKGKDELTSFQMIDINIKFQVNQLNIIAGPTGSGKTSLLMALLGEMTLLDGTVHLPGGRSREDLKPDPETRLTESVAYCAQQAWLVNDTIKQNILFASPLNEKRYKQVIEACSLERDMEILDAGDQTLVGEKGITLSGGQKQRISLARALYSNSRYVLLDDCLSAVDSHTGKWIFDHCILGPLMYDRTCILVTHNVALCVPQSQHVVVLDNGKIKFQGPPDKAMSSGALGEDVKVSRPSSRMGSQIPSRVPSSLGDEGNAGANGTAKGVNGNINGHAKGKDVKPTESSDQDGKANPRTEGKSEGGVNWRVIKLYLASMGGLGFWSMTAFIFAAQQLGSIAPNVWIREWANAYQTKDISVPSLNRMKSPVSFVHTVSNSFSASCFSRGNCAWNVPFFLKQESHGYSAAASSDVNVAYYLGIYAILGLTYLVLCLARDGVVFGGSLAASRTIHRKLLESITRARFRFFDGTPLGQLMNRFSKDIEQVDQEVAAVALGMLSCLGSIITIVILISVITPGFLIPGVFISAIYFFIGKFYIRSSTDLKRLESVQRSPLYQQFGETLSGITTIRAYGDERRFIRENLNRVNTHNRPFISLWAANRWLAFRIDVAGALVSFFAGVFVIINVGRIDAGAAGLSLTYAVTFTENVLWLVRLYAYNEQNMNSVERIKEYLDVDQEAKAHIKETRPAANWPSQGSVQFISYTTRYREDLDPVLKKISFNILPGEKVGIVGRTGAGKSSLALALFRGLEAEEGKILIDDVDIGLIGLQDLRESITIVPQDPTLFTGTIRTNLDPFKLFTDEEIFTALRRVQLVGVPTSGHNSATATPLRPATPATPDSQSSANANSGTTTQRENKNIFLDLSSPVAESGSNLSQGQRQLLCLARALLKNPRVLMMDEATASIDYATDNKIQDTIRDLKSTIITIAHRLQTIIDYDKVLVLDKGEVLEFDHPFILAKKEGSIFRGMCEMSGELESLEEGAKNAWDKKKLVDDSG
ncbi:MAG: hypothetical protein M1827_000555 [Pycnora praestabilis]|nr:MAG: hypothetical protein M1827_000555 [Pycnora praestabilis]